MVQRRNRHACEVSMRDQSTKLVQLGARMEVSIPVCNIISSKFGGPVRRRSIGERQFGHKLRRPSTGSRRQRWLKDLVQSVRCTVTLIAQRWQARLQKAVVRASPCSVVPRDLRELLADAAAGSRALEPRQPDITTGRSSHSQLEPDATI